MSMKKNNMETILLVDDNPTNLHVLFQTLEDIGAKLLVAKNGKSALSIAQKIRPDLILLDIMMPEIDGFEVCRKLKESCQTKDIPVIFLSALDQTEDKVRGLRLGAVDYVSKPFQPDEVKARVNTHLTIHRLKREVQRRKERLEHELQVVSRIQHRLLPAEIPRIDTMKLAFFYETSRHAGGDYFDIIKMPENHWGLLLSDAEGHSAPAAVLMAMTCALFKSFPKLPKEPDEMLIHLNRYLCKLAGPSFVTAIYMVFDAGNRTLKIARAGHPPPMIYNFHGKNAFEAECEGVVPMGIMPYDEVPVTKINLSPGDKIIIYTDGITERFNKENAVYGEKRLLSLLNSLDTQNPEELRDKIMEDVIKFADGLPAEDDQALVAGVVE